VSVPAKFVVARLPASPITRSSTCIPRRSYLLRDLAGAKTLCSVTSSRSLAQCIKTPNKDVDCGGVNLIVVRIIKKRSGHLMKNKPSDQSSQNLEGRQGRRGIEAGAFEYTHH
jgi:hypothetical protein